MHYTTLRYTTLHNATQHNTTQHYTTLHYTTLHYTTLPIYIYTYPYRSISIYTYISICKFKNGAILRDFLNFWPWQHQKRSNSARFRQLLSLTTSKTKLFGETSSIFQLGNIKREAILRGFLQKWKVECRADGLVPLRFAILPAHVSKVLRLPRKSDARSYEVLHLSHKIIFPKLKIWCSKMQPLSGNQRPNLRTRQFFTVLTSKCASRHNGGHFYKISTSKSAPTPNLVHFDFDIWVPEISRQINLY